MVCELCGNVSQRANPYGVCARSTACKTEYMRRYRASKPDYVERQRVLNRAAMAAKYTSEIGRATVLRRYNLTQEDYDRLLEAQGGRCAICRRSPGESGFGHGGLHIDHDHTCCPQSSRSCGACVRGLLCGDCNTGLGKLGDDEETLLRAAGYVRRLWGGAQRKMDAGGKHARQAHA